ncbi:hypothetical protein AVEN_101594-1 [Araneus ventricosus]|uniref:Uncharacterized protein n=1 Tax=Araneus ventricosus TaxID=182803 RepID=A0A4Y2PS04_ARAVE|nr:hypothetical protein AVEN_101594-1 [Araneus ventricosus]
MRQRVPHNMSLTFSIDRILSPDFGPCKSQGLDSTTHTCSVNGLPVDTAQGFCKSVEFKKLVTDTCKSVEMAPSTEMHAEVDLLSQMMSALPCHPEWINPKAKFFDTGKSKLYAFKNGRIDVLLSPRRNPNRHELENLSLLGTSSDYISVAPCSDKQSAPLSKVANFIEDIFDRKVRGLVCDKNLQSSVDYSEQSSSPIPFSINMPGGAEQNKPLAGNKTATSSTKETSSPPKKYQDTTSKASGAKDAQPITKPHQEEDNLQSDETEISCDTKPQVPEELFQNDDRCLSVDGRCSSSSVDTLSSMAESESNHAPTTSGLTKPSLDKIKIIKESLRDDCVDSPPTNFGDSKVEQYSTPNHKLLSEDLGEIIPTGEGWPVWVYCNRYSARPSSGEYNYTFIIFIAQQPVYTLANNFQSFVQQPVYTLANNFQNILE